MGRINFAYLHYSYNKSELCTEGVKISEMIMRKYIMLHKKVSVCLVLRNWYSVTPAVPGNITIS